ncbi:MAG: hypothetical protein KC501_32175 [Myxococcales bacterium]|nr:hypothetical protein [Myxococcales bacterium]
MTTSLLPRSLPIRLMGSPTVAATVSLLALGCAPGDQGDDLDELDHARTVEIVDDSGCAPLIAGTSEVGSVCVTIDDAVDTSAQCGVGMAGVLSVQYTAASGWTIEQTALALGETLSDIPTGATGLPDTKSFPYGGTSAAGTTTATYQVPLCTVGLDAADAACDPVEAHVAAQAVARRSGSFLSTATAWAAGTFFVAGSRPSYFTRTLECAPTCPEGALLPAPWCEWSVYNPQDVALSVEGDALVLEPTNTGAGWYMAERGTQVHQPATGSFAITTLVSVTSLSGGSAFPGDPYRVAGLMIRSPEETVVDTVHMGIGNMGTGGLVVTSKSTHDSLSTIHNQPWSGDLAEMRLCRANDEVVSLIRTPGNPWQVVDQRARPDLPPTVAVGPVAYGWHDTTPDLRASYVGLTIEPVETLVDCLSD